MAFGQGDFFVARQRSNHRDPQRLDRLRDQPPMPLAADPVDHDAGDAEPPVVDGAALDDSGGRLRLARHVDDEEDRKSERRRDVGRGAAAAKRRRNAVEQAHRGLAQSERAPGRRLGGERPHELRRHRPGIEIDAVAAGSRGVKGGIDIVGAGLQARRRESAPPEGAQKAERQSRLAAARARRGDHQAAGHGCAPGASTTSPFSAKRGRCRATPGL